MAKNKTKDDLETEVDAAEVETGDEDTETTPAPKGKGKLVKVHNRGNQTFQHAEHGDLAPGKVGMVPAEYAETLKRISDGTVVDEKTALKEFEDQKSATYGYDQDTETGAAAGGKTTQKAGQR